MRRHASRSAGSTGYGALLLVHWIHHGSAKPVLNTSSKENTIIEMTLSDMSCGHCASTATRICKLVDPAAKVEVDINAKTVKIQSAENRQDFAEALALAGFPAQA